MMSSLIKRARLFKIHLTQRTVPRVKKDRRKIVAGTNRQLFFAKIWHLSKNRLYQSIN